MEKYLHVTHGSTRRIMYLRENQQHDDRHIIGARCMHFFFEFFLVCFICDDRNRPQSMQDSALPVVGSETKTRIIVLGSGIASIGSLTSRKWPTGRATLDVARLARPEYTAAI